MTIKEVYKTFNCIPKAFTLSDGNRFEHTTMQHSDGTWYAYIYVMHGNMRSQLHSFATGQTEDEAIEKLYLANIEPPNQ